MRQPDRHVTRVAGHLGEWLQGRLGPAGPVALITLCCPALGVATCAPPGRLAVPPAARARFARALGVPLPDLGLSADMPPGGGAGVSTAALVALARAAGVVDPARVAAACLAVEGATDPLMLPRPDAVLWAPREARALSDVPQPGRAEIVGGFLGPVERTDPSDDRFPDISDLVARWCEGPRTLRAQAALAAVSAERTTALRGPADDPVARLARDLGALGHVRAHTGSARGLVFSPGTAPAAALEALASLGATGVIGFATGTP